MCLTFHLQDILYFSLLIGETRNLVYTLAILSRGIPSLVKIRAAAVSQVKGLGSFHGG